MALAKTANVNVRIQENIRKQAEDILEMIGIPRATACRYNMFHKAHGGEFLPCAYFECLVAEGIEVIEKKVIIA